jgi:peptidoglycan/xylan/chitin deacetylase (PgdA/CDA1 family)
VTVGPPELHLFIVWSRARDREREILADLAARFAVLEVVEVSWSSERFADNLTRFYGEALPSGSEKERHCGNGPFLVAVVRDREPKLELRRPRGRRLQVVDVHTLEAKDRYRAWTGGGHRVHSTLDPTEFAHDLFLLFGRLPSHYTGLPEWDGAITRWPHELVGSTGWRSADELVTALDVTLGRVALLEPLEQRRTSIEVDDTWWAAVVANGRPGLRDPWAHTHELDVAGKPLTLEIHAARELESGSHGRLHELVARTRARAIDAVARLTAAKVGLALVYHGVGDPQGDRRVELVPSLALETFARQVAVLRGRYNVVPAADLPRAVAVRRRGGRFPVALTFDDSLPSHARLAAPVLNDAGAPATFFLNGVSERKSFWWQDLQRVVDRQQLGPSVDGVREELVAAARERRPSGIRRLAGAIQELVPAARRELARELRSRVVQDGLVAGSEDVAALARAGFAIGFHTLEHDVMPALDDESLQQALTEGREQLAHAAGQPVTLLAYPHGKTDDRVAAAAAAAGYLLAFAGSGRPLRGDDPPLQLPRWEPPFSAGAEFELALARTLRG